MIKRNWLRQRYNGIWHFIFISVKWDSVRKSRMRTAADQKNNENISNRLMIIKRTLLLAEIYYITRFIVYIARILGNKPYKYNSISAMFSYVKRAIRPISFAYSILHLWRYNQSTFRIESLTQSELSNQMASEKCRLDFSASLKFVFRKNGFNFPFRKNSNEIYPTSWALELQFENRWSFKKSRKQI